MDLKAYHQVRADNKWATNAMIAPGMLPNITLPNKAGTISNATLDTIAGILIEAPATDKAINKTN